MAGLDDEMRVSSFIRESSSAIPAFLTVPRLSASVLGDRNVQLSDQRSLAASKLPLGSLQPRIQNRRHTILADLSDCFWKDAC